MSSTESDADFARKVHNDGAGLIHAVASYLKEYGGRINETIFVPVIIACRLSRLREAVAQLAGSGFSAEAGILALSQFEAKIDLGQAVLDPAWCTAWLEHRSVRLSITPNVTDAVTRLYGAQAETEKDIYRRVCMMKHGISLASELGFPVRMRGDVLYQS